MVAQLCEHTTNHCFVHFKLVNCMVCELYLHKDYIKNANLQKWSHILKPQFLSLGISLLLCIIGMILITYEDVERINEAMYVKMLTYHATRVVEIANCPRSVLFLLWHRIGTGKELPRQRLQFPWLLASSYSMI